MSREALGEFEQLVLLAILRLESDVYGIPIVEEIRERTGRDVSRAAVYVTLRRLEQKGMIRSRMGDPSPERGGRAKRYFRVEERGLESLRESRKALTSMWEGVEPLLEEA